LKISMMASYNGGNARNGMNGSGDLDRPREVYRPQEENVDILWNNQISTGINFAKYENISVKVTGENKPDPISSFQSSGLHQLLLNNVSRAKYSVPTPVQKYALPIVREGRDLMACAQTGSGKTAAFILPILSRIIETGPNAGASISPKALVISPTRELAIQIYDEARKFSTGSAVKIGIVYGGADSRFQQMQLTKGCNILVATPGRLLDFTERGHVDISSVQFLVLDEADRMLDMGFMPDIRRCVSKMPRKGSRQTLMFSATFPEEIRRSAGDFLSNYLFLQVGLVGGACSDVSQTFYQTAKFEKRDKFLSILNDGDRDPMERTLVFVKTKRQADFLCVGLCQEGFPATSIHGDRMQSEREQALKDFKQGNKPILVATAVAARGLDIKDVKHVVNYDMPDEVEEYVHRIGRTGRVGNEGRATSFFDSREDLSIARGLVKVLGDAKQIVPDWLAAMGRGGGMGW